ncbi:hypothetical protein [Carnobacterium maltaromaticum]|uniref:hypothetical protein n=1 Tax=Carnobacterium maltaromaticum TaxID=2751 RepID=UPI0012F855C5|nr:hypothetical protein [Carnobacterium maltaromaticum]CAD5903199.1 conserved hypothetical protein [Carnobacterium maltaromaticum]
MDSKIVGEWNPVQVPKESYELEAINYDNKGLLIRLESIQTIVTIHFPGVIEGFRTTDEGNRWKTVSEILSTHNKGIFAGRILFKVSESDFSKWIESESFNFIQKDDVTHYLIVTSNDLTDILAYEDPIISIYDKEKE